MHKGIYIIIVAYIIFIVVMRIFERAEVKFEDKKELFRQDGKKNDNHN